ncbi:MAG: SIS domain-containing protein [Rhodospirillales bacterium]
MTFPDKSFSGIAAYIDAYAEQVARAFASVDRVQLERACDLLDVTYAQGGTVYVCGNGGSASISNHFHCDHLKGVQTDTAIKPRVVSLASTVETLTAIANDISYAEVFAYQLRTMAGPGDVLITVSSSGDSENVVRAASWATDNHVQVIAFTGFAGGRTAAMADVNLHVEADNYGVIEDVHQSMMHILAQFLRLRYMDPALLGSRKF